MNIKQLNKENPGQWVMVTNEFGNPVYIASGSLSGVNITDNIHEAEKWSYADTLSSAKLPYHKAVTGYNGLEFVKI